MKKSAAFVLLMIAASSVAMAIDTMKVCYEARVINFFIQNRGSSPAVSWAWTYTGGTDFGGSVRKDSVLGPIKYNSAGVYLVTVLTTFANSATDLDTFIVVTFKSAIPPFTLNDTTICGNINFTARTGLNPGFYRHIWNPGNATTATRQITSAGPYSVQVYSYDDYSFAPYNLGKCDSIVKNFTVTQASAPQVELGPDRFICNSNPVTLDAGPDGLQYNWLPGGETSQSISVVASGTYTVTVTNAAGCKTTDNIKLKDSCPMYIFMPTAFTPNYDGFNDSFRWVGNVKIKPGTYRFTIFNRWGEKLFDTREPTLSWDGKFGKKYVPDGVYIYLVSLVDTNAERRVLKGSFTVVY